MRVREFVWGVAVWGLAPLVMAFAVSGPIDHWDMSVGAAVGVLVGFAAAFAVVGAIIWMPAAVWLERASQHASVVVRALLFMGMGFAIGAAVVSVLVLASGNATWPYVLGPLFQIAGTAAGASLCGWLVAIIITTAKRRDNRSAVRT